MPDATSHEELPPPVVFGSVSFTGTGETMEHLEFGNVNASHDILLGCSGSFPKSLIHRFRWAFSSAIATVLIALWCLLPWTQKLLPFPAYGAYVAVFLAERTLGRLLRNSADCIFGAMCAAALAWPLGSLHGEHEIFAAIALFAQCFFWAYMEVPLPARRIAMSCTVMICLAAQRKPSLSAGEVRISWRDAVGLVGLVTLSAMIALLGLALLPGSRTAASRARRTSAETRQLAKLLLERNILAFLETDARRLHIAQVQLAELGRAAAQATKQLAQELDDAQWEPRMFCCTSDVRGDPVMLLGQDLSVLQRLTEHCDALRRTLDGLPFNACHSAFADRLAGPLNSVASSIGMLVVGNKIDVEAALSELHGAYGQARREILYPSMLAASADTPEQGVTLHKRQLATLDTCQTSWKTEDLLHMNTFLFTLMNLAAQLGEIRDEAAKPHAGILSGSCASAWKAYVVGLAKTFRPPCPPCMSWDRSVSAARFACAILLAAQLNFVPQLSSQFLLEVWAPVEVTFLMFKHAGGSLRQSILRVEGTILGAVVGYLLVLALGSDHPIILSLCLGVWSLASCLFRSSAGHGYAAIVAAWTAVIIAVEGVSSQDQAAAIPALERMTHAVIGGAAVVLAVNFLLPSWARDAAHSETAVILGRFEGLYAALQEAWMVRSRQMQAGPMGDDESEALSLLRARSETDAGANDAGSQNMNSNTSSSELNRTEQKDRRALLRGLEQRLTGLEALVSEACFEPALWRPPYQAEATRRVAASLMQMLQWLRMFSTYLADVDFDDTEVCNGERSPGSPNSPMLSRVFGLERPRKWLTREWVKSLQGTNQEISAVLSGLGRALKEALAAGKGRPSLRHRWLGGHQHRAEQLYFFAMRIQSLETRLRKELGHFLTRYDWILSGTITDSQLKILAGARTEQFLTNVDVLFYNSLIFSTRGFVEELLKCSKAVRELATAEASSTDFAPALQIAALAEPPSHVASRLADADHISVHEPASQNHALPRPSRGPPGKRLVLTVVGPDRLGIVNDVARAVFENGGSVAASRMAKLDDFFAVVMQLAVPSEAVTVLEKELSRSLPGLQVLMRTAKEGDTFEEPPYQAEVHCVCPQDAPGLLMRFTAVLADAGLNILLLDTELRCLASGRGFLMRAVVGSDVPVDGAQLQVRLDELCESASLGVAARITVAIAPGIKDHALNPQE